MSQLDIEPASTTQIVVVPGSPRYVEGIERLQSLAYNMDASTGDDCISAVKALNHLTVFPEGQFVALDTATEEVIGITSSMRIHFDPNKPFIEPWTTTTDYG